jgi:hypothetical protein
VAGLRVLRECKDQRRHYQGGKQVVQDLTRSSIFENPARLKSEQGSSFPGDAPFSNRGLMAAQTKATILIEQHI